MAAVPLLNGEGSTTSSDGTEDSEKLLTSGQERKRIFGGEDLRKALLLCSLAGITIGFAVGVAILVVNGRHGSPSIASCLQQSTMPSPVTRDLDITYHVQQFNGTFMNENIYRQAGSPEVDAAWEALGINYRAAHVPKDVGMESGLNADQVQIKDKYGGGFPANVEGLHHLHCLNLLRESLYYNIDYYRAKGVGAFKNEDHIVRKHVSHCVDIIRQQLMCTVDIGVLGQVWYHSEADDYPKSFVDFNTKHVCRNYDDIRKWAEKRQLPDDVPEDFLAAPRPGDKIVEGVP